MENFDIKQEIKKLEKQGIFAHDPLSCSKFPGAWVSVRLETAISTVDAKPLQWNIEIVNKRGASITLSDWAVYDADTTGQKVLSFMASMRVPENVSLVANPEYACSFADLCWFQGNESVKANHESEVATKRLVATSYNDLGWYLPCRFADRLVDALGKANDMLLSGVLEDALIYGMYVKKESV